MKSSKSAIQNSKFPRYAEYKDSGVEWLGEVPEHWDTARLKTSFREIDDRSTRGTEKLLSLRMNVGLVPHNDVSDVPISEAQLIGYKRVRTGQIVMNRMRASFGIFAIARSCGLVSPDYSVFDCDESQSADFYLRLFKTPQMMIQFRRFSTGLGTGESGFLRLYTGAFLNIRCPLPPKTDQDRIVAFLDRKTAEIDTLIAKKKRQIELLDEQKAIQINLAVTRGLDPNAKLKPSGIAWLPAIPERWKSIKVRHLAALIQTGPFGSQLHSAEYVENGTPVINPSHMKGGRIFPDFSCAIAETKVAELSRHKLKSGDIVFARRGELGRCGLVTTKESGWICGTGSLLMRPKPDEMNSEYLVLALSNRHVGEVLTLQSVGSTMDNLNTGMISDLAVLMPPLDEQTAIVELVHKTTSAFYRLRRSVESQIQSLQTLRSTLIAHAVTGRIKV